LRRLLTHETAELSRDGLLGGITNPAMATTMSRIGAIDVTV